MKWTCPRLVNEIRVYFKKHNVNIEKLKIYKVISHENSVKILLISIENCIILDLFVLLVLEFSLSLFPTPEYLSCFKCNNF